MSFLIDTDVAIHARDGTPEILERFTQHEGAVSISALTLVELQRGLYRDPGLTARRQLGMSVMLRSIPVLPFDEAAAETYGRIIAACGWQRNRDYCRMIAAHAISVRAVLVTINTADYHDIPGLKLERWRTGPRP